MKGDRDGLERVSLEGVETAPPELLEKLKALVGSARKYAERSHSVRTMGEYTRARAAFLRWCASLNLKPLSPDVVALYLTDRANQGLKPATLELDLAAITTAYREANLPPPTSAATVRRVRAGIRNVKGIAPNQKLPLLAEDLAAAVGKLGHSRLKDIRDRALLLVGFVGAFRRSELVALEVQDLEWSDAGVKVRLRRSKTDQAGSGRVLGLPVGKRAATCPVRALKAWLEAAGIDDGPVFREVTRHGHVLAARLSAGTVARVVKGAAASIGLDPLRFSGHSLRAGLATSAAKAGKEERHIMRHLGSFADLHKIAR
jgi:integrase